MHNNTNRHTGIHQARGLSWKPNQTSCSEQNKNTNEQTTEEHRLNNKQMQTYIKHAYVKKQPRKTTKQSKNLTNLVPCILWQKKKNKAKEIKTKRSNWLQKRRIYLANIDINKSNNSNKKKCLKIRPTIRPMCVCVCVCVTQHSQEPGGFSKAPGIARETFKNMDYLYGTVALCSCLKGSHKNMHT